MDTLPDASWIDTESDYALCYSDGYDSDSDSDLDEDEHVLYVYEDPDEEIDPDAEELNEPMA